MKIEDPSKFLRLLICFSIFGMNVILASGRQLQTIPSERVFNWEGLRETYDAYISCPSQEHAKALLDALPMKRPRKPAGDAERTQLHIFGGTNFPVLSSEVLAGDRLAVEILFRFLNITDGAYSETVETMLAGLVRSKSRLFVEVLLVYRDLEHIKKFGFPVDLVGEGYESHPSALRHEYEKRIEALESVKDPIYSELVGACINKLRESIKRFTQKAPANGLYPDYDTSALAHQACPPVDWNGIREAYGSFVKNPSSHSGEVFVKKLPETPIQDVKEVEEKLKTYFLIISPIDHSPFRNIVLDGNRYAVEAVFRLLNLSDGSGTEELFILLGEVMKLHPRLYLEILDKYRDMEFFKQVGNAVAMNTEALGSKEEKVELQARIDAFETVKDKEYRALRDACILKLQKAMKRERR